MCSRRSRPVTGVVLVVAILCLATGCATRQAPRDSADLAPDPSSVERAIEDASKGDVFALDQMIPRIADPGLAAIARARASASRLHESEVAPILAELLQDPTTSATQQALAWSVMADASFAQGDYTGAAAAAASLSGALEDSGAAQKRIDDARQMESVARVLGASPRQVVAAYAPSPASFGRDKVGLPRARVTINGAEQEAVLDTGANLSVVSRSAAGRLGLRILEGQPTVGSSSREAVATRIGIADELELAGLRLKNVAFLVLDDAHLSFPVPGGYRIDAIVGFPVFREFKRVRFDRSGMFVPEPGLAHPRIGPAGNLRVVGSNLYVEAGINGIPVALHLDSGGTASSLSALFSERHADVVDGLPRQDERLAGAGGATTRVAATLAGARLTLADRSVVVPELSVVISDGADVESDNFGVLGGDVLDRFASWSLDFVNMSFEFGPEPGRVGSVGE